MASPIKKDNINDTRKVRNGFEKPEKKEGREKVKEFSETRKKAEKTGKK